MIVNILEIVGLILIFCGIIYTFLRGMGKISEKEQDEIESKIIKVKGGPGLILISLGVILFLASMQISDPPTFHFPPNRSTPTPTPTPTSTPNKDCFNRYFSGIPKDRLATAEEGAESVLLIRREQSKDELIGINFTDTGQSIGAIKFYFISSNEFFKIQTVIDSNCQEIEDFYNKDRPIDKYVLQNYDTLRITFENDTYELRLGYTDGAIEALSFKRISPRN